MIVAAVVSHVSWYCSNERPPAQFNSESAALSKASSSMEEAPSASAESGGR